MFSEHGKRRKSVGTANGSLARHVMASAISLTLLCAPSLAFSSSAANPFVFGTDQQKNTFAGKWLRRIYVEAFSRMGRQVRFLEMPTSRLASSVDAGIIDGDVIRTYDYGVAHPEFVRVEETVFSIAFAIYTAHPDLQADHLKTIPPHLAGEYRRGVLGCEKALKGALPSHRLSDILTTPQGLKKLASRRTDFYCDTDMAVFNEMSRAKPEEFRAVRRLFDIQEKIPLYPYLTKKHATLAPHLASILKQMKAEGLIEHYKQESLNELGYAP